MNQNYRTYERWKKIISLIDERGYLTVKALSKQCAASEVTIRRDLESLSEQRRLIRTHGGAVSLKKGVEISRDSRLPSVDQSSSARMESQLLERVDVLITTSNNAQFRNLVPDKVLKRQVPVIAEATPCPDAITCISIDNYTAGKTIGRWAGEHVFHHWEGRAFVLDLTYHLPNTIDRSQGFLDGLNEILPGAMRVFSLNTQSLSETARQMTRDALITDPRINIIFAINDQTALGAIQACEELKLDPENLIVIPFGLEGNAMLDLLASSPYCQAGLAMFPELVGKVCLEAAVRAYNHQPLPENLVMPHAIIEKDQLARIYCKQGSDWKLQPGFMAELDSPLFIQKKLRRDHEKIPHLIGIAVSFLEHEWYKNVCTAMVEHGKQSAIDIVLIDMEQTIKDEIELRRREIARQAAKEVRPGEVVFIDSGPLAGYLAEALPQEKRITVITNSMVAMESLKNKKGIILIGTGGVLQTSSQAFVGPIAENNTREIRADHLFLSVTGVSVDFGLSHANFSEVTIKQTMIRSSRRVVLLADHSMFETESTVQVAPIQAVNCLITDDALPASTRVHISQLGIQVIVAGV